MNEALFSAVKKGDLEAVLAEAERDPASLSERDANGVSAVMTAVYYGKPQIAQALIERGAPVDAHEAAAVGRADLLARALDEDPPLLDAYSADGFTPLQLAAFFGQAEAMQLLLERGANARLASRGGLKTSPLLAALAGPRPDLAIALVKAGADVHARGDSGFTPLHSAAHHDRPDVIQALLDAGADPQARTDDGKTPLDIAEEKGKRRVADILRFHKGVLD